MRPVNNPYRPSAPCAANGRSGRRPARVRRQPDGRFEISYLPFAPADFFSGARSVDGR